MTPSEALLKAAEIIEEQGWCRGRLADGSKRCALGAIKQACGFLSNYVMAESVRNAAHARLIRSLGFPRSIPTWNDEPGRTKEEVIAALRAAAKQEGL